MISDFISSWPLFHNTYLVGWLVAFNLAMIGVFVVARDQVFIGAAVSQASTLGIAVALLAAERVLHDRPWPGLTGDSLAAAMAVVFSLLAALITARGGGEGRESHEAITGWVFLLSGSLSILLLSSSPHGLEEIQRLFSSSIIGATDADAVLFALLGAVAAGFIAVNRRRLLLFAMDPAMAAAVGMRVRLWQVATSAWMGLSVGLSIRCAGTLYTFGLLVLPALIAKSLCRELQSIFALSPVLALLFAGAGFVVANHYDFPPGQMSVGLLSLALPLGWLLRRALLRQEAPASASARR